MTATPCLAKVTTFYQLLEATPGLDGRDNRGKKHSVALVLTGLILALCSGRDGKLSRLHRHLVNHFDALCQAIPVSRQAPISRAQLPLLLAKTNGVLFAQLLFDWFGLRLDADAKQWFAVDGKELRGSIRPGHSRGEACVSALAHDSQVVVNQAYYTGSKESERPIVADLLQKTGLATQKLTLDALHLTPGTLQAIHGAQGVYVVGLKSNQAHLYRYGICHCLLKKAEHERIDAPERGHGRVDQRSYACFAIRPSALASRWKQAGITTVVRVKRSRQGLNGSEPSEEISYFLSNFQPATRQQASELFDAIRQHWRIEAMHHRRDVTLSEDALRTGKQTLSRLMSSLRTLVVNLLGRAKPKNMAALLDSFADKFHTLIHFMTHQLVL